MQKRLYILAGQSNMRGQGLVSELPPDLSGPLSGVHMWSGSAWAVLEAGVNNRADAGKFGPEISFGKAIRDETDAEIYLVKYSASNTRLEFNPSGGDWSPESDGDLYDGMITMAQNALASDPDLVPKALLWMQGESDNIEGFSARYRDNFRAFCAAVRGDLRPDLPIVSALIRDTVSVTGTPKTVNMAFRQMTHENFYNHHVETAGFGFIDSLHFSSAGQISLGEAYCNAVKRL